MADINITDNLGLSADLKIRDDSPLAKAGLTNFVSPAKELFAEFGKPVDQADVVMFQLGASATSSNLLSSDLPTLTLGGNINAGLTIKTSRNGLLFEDDDFSPSIPIPANQAWVGVELDAGLKADANATSGSVGVELLADARLRFTTYTRSSVVDGPLPTLHDALSNALNNFTVATSPAVIRAQPVDTVYETEASGSITTTVTLQQGVDINALASADLPLAGKVSVQPAVTLKLGGSLKLEGDFLVRSFKTSADELVFGVYVKTGAALAASFTALAGIAGNIGDDDVLSALLNAVLPGVNVSASGISGDDAKALNKVVKDSLDRSLSVQLRGLASTTRTHEAAVLFTISLNSGDAAATDAALQHALRGNWSALDSLSNARRLNDIVRKTVDNKLALSLNLFGLYSASTTAEYIKSCTIRRDYDTNQLTIIDKAESSRITAAVVPFAADGQKLRRALMEDFLSTMTYAAAIGSKLGFDMTVKQTYLDYQASMPRDEMYQNVHLGYVLGVVPEGELDSAMSGRSAFDHACVTATVAYTTDQALAFFFSDVPNRKPRTQDEIDSIGRATLAALIPPSDDIGKTRIAILRNDHAWATMVDKGQFNFHSVPELVSLSSTALSDIVADYVSIRWWSNALTQVAPALISTLKALDDLGANDPTTDPGFTAQRKNLANRIGGVTRNLDAAFVNSWGEGVMFALAGSQGTATIDFIWNGQQKHYSNG